jgi:hypothetical protein
VTSPHERIPNSGHFTIIPITPTDLQLPNKHLPLQWHSANSLPLHNSNVTRELLASYSLSLPVNRPYCSLVFPVCLTKSIAVMLKVPASSKKGASNALTISSGEKDTILLVDEDESDVERGGVSMC